MILLGPLAMFGGLVATAWAASRWPAPLLRPPARDEDQALKQLRREDDARHRELDERDRRREKEDTGWHLGTVA